MTSLPVARRRPTDQHRRPARRLADGGPSTSPLVFYENPLAYRVCQILKGSGVSYNIETLGRCDLMWILDRGRWRRTPATATVRALPGRLSVLIVLHSKSVVFLCMVVLYGRAGRVTF
jgi:hypothetical protein